MHHLRTWQLFATCVLIWSTTWYAITFQIGEMSPEAGVALRFAIAGCTVLGWRALVGDRLRFGRADHARFALQGAFLYGVSYVAVYHAEQHVVSGLVAVGYSASPLVTGLGAHWLFGVRVTRRFVAGGLLGLLGVALIFWPDLIGASAKPQFLSGLGMGLMAVGFATLGNVLTLRLTRQGLALLPLLAWSMGYGALALLGFAAASGLGWHLDPRPSYWLALLYLSAFGSVAAFLLYFKLAHRHGPGRAALTGMVIPVVALAVSAALEGWRPTLESGLGMLLCLGGLWGASRPAPVTAGG